MKYILFTLVIVVWACVNIRPTAHNKLMNETPSQVLIDKVTGKNSLIITNMFIKNDSNKWSLNKLALYKLDSILYDTSHDYTITVYNVTHKEYQYTYLNSTVQNTKIKMIKDHLIKIGSDSIVLVQRDEFGYTSSEFPSDSFDLFLKSIFIMVRSANSTSPFKVR